jgi:hypothetical protein
MENVIPNFISYELLLQVICTRAVSGRTTDEIVYLVELAEDLCRLMRERDTRTRSQ